MSVPKRITFGIRNEDAEHWEASSRAMDLTPLHLSLDKATEQRLFSQCGFRKEKGPI
jgi:hypothetical protein